MRLSDIAAGARVVVDANIFVYELLEDEQFSAPCGALLDRIGEGEVEGVVTGPIVAETMHRLMILEAVKTQGITPRQAAARLRADRAMVRGLTAWRQFVMVIEEAGFQILTVDLAMMRTIREACEEYGLLATDAFTVAAMRANGIEDIATNDEDFLRVPGLRVWRPG